MYFTSVSGFPEGLLGYPDHVMIKSSSPSDFEEKVKAIRPWAEESAFMEIDSRFLVAAHLVVPLALAEHKPVEWLEIMEPKSPDGTVDYLGAEYAEFYYEDFNKAGLLMKRNKIPYEKRTDDNHRWWNVRINDKGQELRVTDKPLSEIVDKELDEGTARYLKAA